MAQTHLRQFEMGSLWLHPGLILYAYLTVTVSLALRYHLARRGEWNLSILRTAHLDSLGGGAAWSFIVAVFKDPGSPMGRAGDRESWGTSRRSEYEMGTEEGEDEAQSLMQGHESESARAPLLNAPFPVNRNTLLALDEQLDDLQSLSALTPQTSTTPSNDAPTSGSNHPATYDGAPNAQPPNRIVRITAPPANVVSFVWTIIAHG